MYLFCLAFSPFFGNYFEIHSTLCVLIIYSFFIILSILLHGYTTVHLSINLIGHLGYS